MNTGIPKGTQKILIKWPWDAFYAMFNFPLPIAVVKRVSFCLMNYISKYTHVLYLYKSMGHCQKSFQYQGKNRKTIPDDSWEETTTTFRQCSPIRECQ